MRNARQILDIVLAAFGPEILESDATSASLSDSKADYQNLARGWKDLADNYENYVDVDHIPLGLLITEACL